MNLVAAHSLQPELLDRQRQKQQVPSCTHPEDTFVYPESPAASESYQYRSPPGSPGRNNSSSERSPCPEQSSPTVSHKSSIQSDDLPCAMPTNVKGGIGLAIYNQRQAETLLQEILENLVISEDTIESKSTTGRSSSSCVPADDPDAIRVRASQFRALQLLNQDTTTFTKGKVPTIDSKRRFARRLTKPLAARRVAQFKNEEGQKTEVEQLQAKYKKDGVTFSKPKPRSLQLRNRPEKRATTTRRKVVLVPDDERDCPEITSGVKSQMRDAIAQVKVKSLLKVLSTNID